MVIVAVPALPAVTGAGLGDSATVKSGACVEFTVTLVELPGSQLVSPRYCTLIVFVPTGNFVRNPNVPICPAPTVSESVESNCAGAPFSESQNCTLPEGLARFAPATFPPVVRPVTRATMLTCWSEVICAGAVTATCVAPWFTVKVLAALEEGALLASPE